MKILAIETSCDETALAIIEAKGNLTNPKFKIIGEVINSQIEIHKEFGGVFPSMAKREHVKNLVPLLIELLKTSKTSRDNSCKIPDQVWNDRNREIRKILERESGLTEELLDFLKTSEKPQIDLIVVTSGPGLEPCLWTGINFAKALSLAWQIPLMPVNHMEGHITSVLINNKNKFPFNIFSKNKFKFPALALLISGGHTEIISIDNWGQYKIIGQTLDDAIGEAYDKVARLLDLPYPGGPEIAKLANEARRKDPRFRGDDEEIEISFPRPMVNSKDYNFSFSGLKTSVLYKTQELGELSIPMKQIIAREFEQAIVDILIKKVGKALDEFNVKNLIVGGGVIANTYIRENLSNLSAEKNIKINFPRKELSTDNAVMIGIAGYLKSFREKAEINSNIKAEGNLTYK